MRKMLEEKLARFEELEQKMSDPQVQADSSRMAAVAREHGSLTKLATKYRRFKIAVDRNDDFAAMYQVLYRRFRRARELDAGWELPDLVVVDGGKGQLNVALSVLSELKIKLDVIGLAKEERTYLAVKNKLWGKAVKSEDRVYLPRRKDAVFLSSRPAALSLLQRVRDEAHRFALSYHHQLKQKNDFHSILDTIPDMGKERKKMLLKHFGSAHQVQNASLEDLQKVPGIGKELAEKIYSHLKNEK